MGLPSLNITLGEGGLGRPLSGKDHISSILFYTPNGTVTLPTGFGTDRIKKVISLKEAEDLGITTAIVTFTVLHYHISEFFRMNPGGVLWIGIFEQLLTPAYTEIDLIQKEAGGEIRQMGIFEEIAYNVSALDLIQGVAETLRDEGQPLSTLYASDISGTADVVALATLRTLEDSLVSVIIGQDGSGVGAALFVTQGYSITMLGATLGVVSLANVNESFAWVERFNIQDGDEYDIVVFANDQSVKAQSKAFLDTLNDKGFIFLRKFSEVGLDGSYHNDTHTAIIETSDFATVENNRTIDKASRLITLNTLPKLNSPLLVNANGQLNESTTAVFKNLAELGLEQMLIDGEISAFEVIIDPTQNVLSTSKIEITVKIVPVGVARTIDFTVGYTLNIG